MCLYTKYILNRKYMYTKKNQGNVPECKDERLRYVPTKCGKCIECRKEKARSWRIRLAEELKKNPNALFITLTFNEKNYQKLAWELFKKSKKNLNYTEQNEMCKTAVRRWLERIRKKTGKSIKHWMVTEKGEDYGRIHLHGIVWCSKERINQWGYGYTYIGDYVNQTTIAYVTKYMLKICEKWPDFRGKVMCSAGIGSSYDTSYNAKRNRYRGEDTKETYKMEDGAELPLPKYYHDKLYTEEERENLWIIKQERGYRYIAGEKVSTDNLEEWDNLTRYYQRRAEQLYGDNPEDWEREKVKARLERMRLARLKSRKLR